METISVVKQTLKHSENMHMEMLALEECDMVEIICVMVSKLRQETLIGIIWFLLLRICEL